MEYTRDYEDYEDYEDTVILSEVQVKRIRNHAYDEDLPVLTPQQRQQDISEKEQMKNWFDNYVTSFSAAELPTLSICLTDKMVYDYLKRQRERSHGVWNQLDIVIVGSQYTLNLYRLLIGFFVLLVIWTMFLMRLHNLVQKPQHQITVCMIV
jgi:hypothetical protein